MKIKKLFCILFATALLLAGCSSPAPQAVTEPETVTEPDPADPQEQIKLLANSVDIWRVPNDLEYEPIQPIPGGQGLDAEIGAVNDTVAVQNQQLHTFLHFAP